MKFTDFLALLKSAKFGLWLFIGALIVQAHHSYYIFYELSSLPVYFREVQAGFYALLLSGTILYFGVRKQKRLAQGAAWFESLINLFYFSNHIYNTVIEGGDLNYYHLIVAIPISIVIPLTLFFFTEEIEKGEIEFFFSKYYATLPEYLKIKMVADTEKAAYRKVKIELQEESDRVIQSANEEAKIIIKETNDDLRLKREENAALVEKNRLLLADFMNIETQVKDILDKAQKEADQIIETAKNEAAELSIKIDTPIETFEFVDKKINEFKQARLNELETFLDKHQKDLIKLRIEPFEEKIKELVQTKEDLEYQIETLGLTIVKLEQDFSEVSEHEKEIEKISTELKNKQIELIQVEEQVEASRLELAQLELLISNASEQVKEVEPREQTLQDSLNMLTSTPEEEEQKKNDPLGIDFL